MRRSWPIFFFGVLLLVLVSQTYPLATAQSRMLYGFVYSATTGKPLAATIVVSRCFNQQTVITNANGLWMLFYAPGTLGTITFSAPGYATQTLQLNLNAEWYYSGGIISLTPG